MLEIRPNCEFCDKDLAPDSTEARICSYECTFCCDCVENLLHNVCPNCGGGFVARPIRPVTERRPGTSLRQQPASSRRVQAKFNQSEIEAFADGIKNIAPELR
jgi:hypothetical protein